LNKDPEGIGSAPGCDRRSEPSDCGVMLARDGR